ncbi:MAG: exodeoxyribonuclease VII large subunit [Clostridia bacterium]|nr:exodeoxyribonuclease VII large subunit [Clostridia bacterium]
MAKRIISVSELNEYIKLVLEHDELLMNICVKGEISNFTNHYKTGHLYFSLKDAGGAVKTVMFRGNAIRLKFKPENGMKVLVSGRIGVFPRDGQYQLYAESMEPDGIGALALAFEQLKAKLAAEGLFDERRKKPLPYMPMRIGVITSPTGAAIRDILNILGRRFPMAEVELYPALVQGENACADLVKGLARMNRERRVDVIIIGRGGGSIEDLWAFNEEPLVRAVAASEIPVISAVGHETDFTLCDFAADRRAPTPSAAAELAVPNAADLVYTVQEAELRLSRAMTRRLSLMRERLDRLSASRVLKNPQYVIDDKRMALANEERMLTERMQALLRDKRAKLGERSGKLSALDPLAVLARGYGAVFDEGGRVVKCVDDTAVGETVMLALSDGRLSATVNAIEKETIEKEAT